MAWGSEGLGLWAQNPPLMVNLCTLFAFFVFFFLPCTYVIFKRKTVNLKKQSCTYLLTFSSET